MPTRLLIAGLLAVVAWQGALAFRAAPPASPPPWRGEAVLRDLLGGRDPEAAGEAGRELFGRRAAALLHASRAENPLRLSRPEREELFRRVDRLQATSSWMSWSELRLAEEIRAPEASVPAIVRWLSLADGARAARVGSRRLSRDGEGRLPLEELPEDGPPEAGPAVKPMGLLLLHLHGERSRMSAERRAALAAELDRWSRAASLSDAAWDRALELLSGTPERRRLLAEAPEDWKLLGAEPTVNDVASHAAVQLEPFAPEHGQEEEGLTLGHPAAHLAACGYCRRTLGARVDEFLGSLGVSPADFATPERRLALLRSLRGRSRAEVFSLFGPPAESTETGWTYHAASQSVLLRFDSRGLVQ